MCSADCREDDVLNTLPKNIPQDVAELFVGYAFDLLTKDITSYSADAILHRIRWHMVVERGVRTFKCNNNWTPALARWAMDNHPQLRGMFSTRITNEERKAVS